VPVWHRLTKELVESGELAVVGVIQEQHPDRCRLFTQWQQIGWPILHDPICSLDLAAVPVPVAIDEHGIVRVARANPRTIREQFLEVEFDAPGKAGTGERATLLDPDATGKTAAKKGTAEAWRAHGDALVLGGHHDRISEAIDAYEKAVAASKRSAELRFRLGVAHRMRYDGPQREERDFQAAVDAWQQALAIRPNQYIYRRRIQQYGPRLDKPYPFYDWISEARRQIEARGDTPVALVAEPVGAELASPMRRFTTDSDADMPGGDPDGRITRDDELIRVEPVVVRGTTARGKTAAQVHLTFRPDPQAKGHWNNEAEPLRIFLEPPRAGRLGTTFLEHPGDPTRAVSLEPRTVSFQLALPEDAPRDLRVRGYALFNACAGEDGVCKYLRKDFEVRVPEE